MFLFPIFHAWHTLMVYRSPNHPSIFNHQQFDGILHLSIRPAFKFLQYLKQWPPSNNILNINNHLKNVSFQTICAYLHVIGNNKRHIYIEIHFIFVEMAPWCMKLVCDRISVNWLSCIIGDRNSLRNSHSRKKEMERENRALWTLKGLSINHGQATTKRVIHLWGCHFWRTPIFHRFQEGGNFLPFTFYFMKFKFIQISIRMSHLRLAIFLFKVVFQTQPCAAWNHANWKNLPFAESFGVEFQLRRVLFDECSSLIPEKEAK